MSASTAVAPRITHCAFCQARVWWVVHAELDRYMTLNPSAVPPDRRGAMVLIGRFAFTRVAGVRRLAEMFAVSEERADELARNTYTWHLPHLATCTHREDV